MKSKIYIFGGGTYDFTCTHGAWSSVAFGSVAKKLMNKMNAMIQEKNLQEQYEVELVLTKMADPENSTLYTNEDVKEKILQINADPATRGVIFSTALADFEVRIEGQDSGKYAKRLETANGPVPAMLYPKEKIIPLIRKNRKDIFVVGFKTTANQSDEILYQKSLKLLKNSSINLVIGNDVVRKRNMIVTPEESHYGLGQKREDVLDLLVKMFVARMTNTFTRSTVVDSPSIDWNGELVPENLRIAVNHCIEEGAYKPFLGKTVGHFAYRLSENTIATSKRKTNFNDLDKVGLVKIESVNENEVIAYGAKPSVGGQSQRYIFNKHNDVNCILHFHCPMKPEADKNIQIASQWQNECGSHECGENTSKNMAEIDLGGGHKVKVVYLDNHGPNIAFDKDIDVNKLISFVDQNFDLKSKTGGLFSAEYVM